MFFVGTEYVDVLMDVIVNQVFADPAPYTAALLAIPIPENISAQFERPDKEDAITTFASRFKVGDA